MQVKGEISTKVSPEHHWSSSFVKLDARLQPILKYFSLRYYPSSLIRIPLIIIEQVLSQQQSNLLRKKIQIAWILPATVRAMPTEDGCPSNWRSTQFWFTTLHNRLLTPLHYNWNLKYLNPSIVNKWYWHIKFFPDSFNLKAMLLSSSLVNPGKKKWYSRKEIYVPCSVFIQSM